MDKKEFEKRLKNLPEEEPDEIDRIMLDAADTASSGEMNLEDFKCLMDYSGNISLRVPRSLHKELAEAAKVEGVSLNQYALYKLSH